MPVLLTILNTISQKQLAPLYDFIAATRLAHNPSLAHYTEFQKFPASQPKLLTNKWK